MEFYEKNIRVDFIKDANLDPSVCYEFVKSPKCGAINLLAGTIRDSDIKMDMNMPIKSIYYEAYEPMAMAQVIDIVRETIGEVGANGMHRLKDANSKACVNLRLGDVPVGEASIIISVSSTGRKLSHETTMTILNKIKATVVIWKKISYIDGSEHWDHEKKSEAFWLDHGDKPKQR